jgi:uncharacterized RDD family membrane protein YckC
LRQSAQQEDATSLSWKEEVNRRVAEHKVRRGQPASSQAGPTDSHPNGSVAAKAAARVAARYAKAPSYSQMLAEEARAAVRSAEAASRAALQAQVVAESVLAGLEAAAEPSPIDAWEPEFFTAPNPEPARIAAVEPVLDLSLAEQLSSAPAQRQSFEIRWDADLPVRDPEPAVGRASRGNSILEIPAENQWQAGHEAHDNFDEQGFEVVEADRPIHANLIAFPRELVATRKIRPRRAEGPYATSVEAQCQLSIFEVEPSAISTEPPAASPKGAAGAQIWVDPEWSGIKLDEEAERQIAIPEPQLAKEEDFRPEESHMALQLAPLNQRILAAIVDFSLITSAFLAALLVASYNTAVLPSIKEIGLGSALTWALIGALYQCFFFFLSRTTPGMVYAHLQLCTLAGKRPARAQRCARGAALFLSLLPMGLGLIWSIFDGRNLTWHDRLSGTYLRKG